MAMRFDPDRPFSRDEALAAGLTTGELRGRQFRLLHRGIYVASSAPDSIRVRVAGALKLYVPSAFASHTSAARILGLPVPDQGVEHVSVFRSTDRRKNSDIISHLAPGSALVTTWQGIRVSAPFQTFVELAGLLSMVELVAVGDALVRRGTSSARDLREFCAAYAGRHAVAARRAASYARDGVDSPRESRLRLLIVLAGLPEPIINFKIRDEDGAVLYRFDLSFPGLKIVVEYDGRQHAESSRQWRADIRRREWLDNHGWRLIVVENEGIFTEPRVTVERVYGVLAARGCPDLPRVISDAWRRHFGRPG